MTLALDPLALVLAVPFSYCAYKITKLATVPPVRMLPTVPNPPGLLGILFQHLFTIFREDFAAPQRRWAAEMRKSHGDQKGSTFCYNRYGSRRVLVSHPQDLEHVFFKNAANYVKGSDYLILEEMTGPMSLVTLRDEAVHSQQRRMVSPAFNPRTLKDIANGILVKQIHQGFQAVPTSDNDLKDVDLAHVFDAIALGTVSEASFKQGEEERSRTTDLFRDIQGGASALNLTPVWFQRLVSSKRSQRDKAVRELRQIGQGIINKTKKENDHDAKSTALIDHLVSNDQLSESATIDHIITFLFAGHETTSKGLLWTAYLLAANPHKQATLFEEVSAAVGLDTVPSLDSVKDLNFLNCVVKESLRIYSPIGLVFRSGKEDDVLPYSGAFVPKGSVVVYMSYVSHIVPSVFGPKAEDFEPERWAENTNTTNSGADKCDWMPFMIGKRNCIGKDFAMNELLMVIATLVRRYEIKLSADTKEVLKKNKDGKPRTTTRVSVQPKGKMTFELVPRKQ